MGFRGQSYLNRGATFPGRILVFSSVNTTDLILCTYHTFLVKVPAAVSISSTLRSVNNPVFHPSQAVSQSFEIVQICCCEQYTAPNAARARGNDVEDKVRTQRQFVYCTGGGGGGCRLAEVLVEPMQ